MMVTQWRAVAILLGFSTCCTCHSRHERREPARTAAMSGKEGHFDSAADATHHGVPAHLPDAALPLEERTIFFAWKPVDAKFSEYAMSASEDQHRVLLTSGVVKGNAYPVVVALHGQPRRGQAPRSYVFPGVVADVTRDLVQAGQVVPIVLVTPVFRFEGQNWPQFGLADFMVQVRRILSEKGLNIKGTYVFGHSGAAGCGGGGLNRVAEASPSAVGFFDTCIGEGFVGAARELGRRGIPTLIMHSVETAGFRPRQPVEYDANFDFGRVYSTMGLHVAQCPSRLPEAPLRRLAFRCATNADGTTQALVVDTGHGENAHEALVPIAVRYFLREYLHR